MTEQQKTEPTCYAKMICGSEEFEACEYHRACGTAFANRHPSTEESTPADGLPDVVAVVEEIAALDGKTIFNGTGDVSPGDYLCRLSDVERIVRERDDWEQEAKRYAQNAEYWRQKELIAANEKLAATQAELAEARKMLLLVEPSGDFTGCESQVGEDIGTAINDFLSRPTGTTEALNRRIVEVIEECAEKCFEYDFTLDCASGIRAMKAKYQ